jgi:hypothetical protein
MAGNERLPYQVEIALRDGRVVKTQRLHADGAIERPLGSSERQMKFADCLRWAGLNNKSNWYERAVDLANASSFRLLWDEMQQGLRQ